MAGYGDIFSSGGGALASLFGSDDAPKAVLNRFAAPTAKASGALSSGLLNDVNSLSKNALDQYLSYQPKMGALVGQQEGCLLYTSDAADERSSVDLGGRRIIKK